MTTIEYLSMSGPQRTFFKTVDFFRSLPQRIERKGARFPSKLRNFGKKLMGPVNTCVDAAVHGDWRTRLSFLFMGFGQITRHQIIRGVCYFVYEVAFIIYMALFGGKYLKAMPSLGQLGQISIPVDNQSSFINIYYDNSLQILLYSVISIAFILILAYLYFSQLKDSMNLQRAAYIGRRSNEKQTLKNILDRSYAKTLLTIPMIGLFSFTVLPVVIMILIGFTNYNSYHQPPAALIDWVLFENWANLFSTSSSSGDGGIFLYAFGMVLMWTLVWAFFATFSNYFLGMIVAMIINAKGVKLKKLWRTVLVTTIAVPQFISLLLMSKMLASSGGVVNELLKQWGLISANIPWLSDPIIAKVTIILVNTWIGIPYTMLMCTGLLMNIPADLYESAKIDGASPFKTYTKITLPYMLFVTTPYLISQFVGNINNFNVIYLLSGGGPSFVFTGTVPQQVAGVGETDLLITWIYKMTMTNAFNDYGAASILGLMIFVVVAFFSLIVFNNSKSIKNEEDYQ